MSRGVFIRQTTRSAKERTFALSCLGRKTRQATLVLISPWRGLSTLVAMETVG